MKLNLLQLSSAPGKIVLENKSLYTEVYQRYSGKFVWRQWGKRIPSLQSSRTIALIFGHALLKNKPQTKCFSKENFSWYFSVRSKLGLKGGSNLLDISYHTFFCRNFEGEDFNSDACNTDLQRLFFYRRSVVVDWNSSWDLTHAGKRQWMRFCESHFLMNIWTSFRARQYDVVWYLAGTNHFHY